MSKKDLPLSNGKRICKVFESMNRGWSLFGKSEKNHFILRNPALPYVFLSIPDHNPVDRNTLKAELRKATISDSDFAEAYANLFGKGTGKGHANVCEMEFCPICHEHIKPGEETIIQTSGLNAHKACHEQLFGTA